jgi:hypothetical protein
LFSLKVKAALPTKTIWNKAAMLHKMNKSALPSALRVGGLARKKSGLSRQYLDPFGLG